MNNYLDDRKARVEAYLKNIRGKDLKTSKIDIPEGLFIKCEQCFEYIYLEDLVNNKHICHNCNYHFRIDPRTRINLIVDEGSFEEMFADIESTNPLDFPNYLDKINEYQQKTGEKEAIVTGIARIGKQEAAIAVMNSFFMMGSMGCAVGEKLTRLVEYATKNNYPLVIFSASGGARMQEGIYSLMQMAKTSAAIRRHHEKGLFYLSVLTNPTTGGVAASFACLGDIIIGESGALIGFAGQRVIKQTIKEDLPEGFQTADFQLKKGFLDMVIDRNKLKNVIADLLVFHKEE